MNITYKNYDDSKLLYLLNKEGDRKAFEAIYDKYAEKLFRYIYVRIRKKEISEEFVQDVFLSIWEKRMQITINENFGAYLFGAAKNKILNYIRSKDIKEKYANHFTIFIAENYDNSVEELMNLNDIWTVVERSISQLPKRCQEAFMMSRIENKSIEEIADYMKISHRTVENYLTQALKHLRENIGEILTVILYLMRP